MKSNDMTPGEKILWMIEDVYGWTPQPGIDHIDLLDAAVAADGQPLSDEETDILCGDDSHPMLVEVKKKFPLTAQAVTHVYKSW